MHFSVHEVSFRYPHLKEWTLRDVSFSIQQGEVVALVGKSGSGKSTLGYLLSGIIPKLIHGEWTGSLSFKPEDVGLVTQMPENQLFGYRVEDAILFGLENLGLPSWEIEKRIHEVTEITELLGLQRMRNRAVHTLSGGQKQSVCIASVLALKPKLLILDEPVSSLDPQGKQLVSNLLKRLREQGQTILLIDQNLEWSSDVVDRVIGLENGQIVFDGKLAEFLQDNSLYKRLGVTIPQMAELFHAISEGGAEIPFFYNVETAVERFHPYKYSLLHSLNNAIDKSNHSKSNGNVVLSTQNLVQEFEGLRVLHDITLQFNEGKVTAILGQNGSGKTTLVKHFNRLLKPVSGEVLFRQQSIQKRSIADMSKDVALVFQHPDHMLFEDSIWNEITFSLKTQGIPINRDEIVKLLDGYPYLQNLEAFPMNLSMGQKHMLTILSVLLVKPSVLILDEPTLGMDREMKQQLVQIIRELKHEGKTILLISHEMSFVAEVADRIVLMKNGSVIGQGDVAEMFQRKDLFRDMNLQIPPLRLLADSLELPSHILTVPAFVEMVKGVLDKERISP